MSGTVKEVQTTLPNNYKLPGESYHALMNDFFTHHPYKEISSDELRQLSVERLNGRKVSEMIREERNEGY